MEITPKTKIYPTGLILTDKQADYVARNNSPIHFNNTKTMKLPNGTTLTGNGLNLVLKDSHCVPEPGSCAEDTWEYEWIKVCGGSHIITDTELAGLLADGAKLGGVE